MKSITFVGSSQGKNESPTCMVSKLTFECMRGPPTHHVTVSNRMIIDFRTTEVYLNSLIDENIRIYSNIIVTCPLLNKIKK